MEGAWSDLREGLGVARRWGRLWHRVVRLEIQVWLWPPFGDNIFICSTYEGFKKFILCTYTLSEPSPFYRHALQLYVFGTPRAQFSPFAAHWGWIWLHSRLSWGRDWQPYWLCCTLGNISGLTHTHTGTQTVVNHGLLTLSSVKSLHDIWLFHIWFIFHCEEDILDVEACKSQTSSQNKSVLYARFIRRVKPGTY